MTKKHLAVFDWNSTLFDDIYATHEATNACLKFFDIPPLSLEQEQELFTFPLIHFYEKAGVNVDDYLKSTDAVSDIFHNKYNSLKKQCGLMTGAIEVLNFCKSHHMHCIVLSNYNQAELEQDVKHFQIDHYFENISGNTDPAAITSGTNKLERLSSYMDDHGFKPQNTFTIGDSHEEPQLAKQLDILGVSMAGGLLSPARLEKYKKDYVISNFIDLIDILTKEWGLPEGNENVKTVS